MGILRGREQLIPVTCAVLKDSDRESFFSQIRKNKAGSPEELAKWLAVPVALINDWMSGQLHIPYHTLQNIAYQFSIEMPPVGELRRESLPAEQLPSTQPPSSPPPPSYGTQESRSRERKRREPRAERQKPPKFQKQKPAKHNPQPAQEPTEPSWPKPSEALAYWAGILYAAARVEGDALSFAADRKIGQNFAGVWARKTKQLFGVSCHLSMQDDGKVQHAKCEIPGLNKYLARLCPGGGLGEEAAALPRWIWSNQDWKVAYLKGLADVSASFQRQPAIVLEVSESARTSAQKLLGSLGFKPHASGSGDFVLSGFEEVKRYFDSIGTENMKLRDQWNNFCRGKAEEPAANANETMGAAPVIETPPQTKTAHAPSTRKRPPRTRRTVYRGRPGQ